MKDVFLLLDAIHTAFSRPEYLPGPNGLTHCNAFVSDVVTQCGFKEMDGLPANEIVKLLPMHPQWSEMPMEKAQEAGNAGTLIVAGILGDPHGHVCVVCPGRPKTSGRWGTVPTVASVGERNMIAGLNWAFRNLPKLWAYRPSL